MLSKSKSLPSHALHIVTYANLEKCAQAFATGHLQSLVLIGPPGVGKSATFRTALGPNVCWMGGNASPFGIYLNAFRHLNKPLVLDDIDDLYRTPQGVRLLKALCQTDSIRTLSWQTQARELDRQGIPRSFETRSCVALIANEWETLSPNIAAIEDRVHLLVFAPSPQEIHLQASRWFWHQEIFDFVGAHLPLLANHSMRLYVRASQLHLAGMDWRATIVAQLYQGVTRVVAELKADPTYASEEERVRAFVQASPCGDGNSANRSEK